MNQTDQKVIYFLKMIQTLKIDLIFKNIIQSQVLITPFFSHEYGYE